MSKELIDQLIKDGHCPHDLVAESGLLKELTKKWAERALEAEIDIHLGYAKHNVEGNNSGNSRNGKTIKQVQTFNGDMALAIPRDRNATFKPVLIAKGERQLNGFDERIISLYAKGLPAQDTQAYLKEIYGVDASAALISQVTNKVMDEVKSWQERPLGHSYPLVYFDCLVVKSKNSRVLGNKSVCFALGINMKKEKELLGLWIAKTQGAKFWSSVMTELKNRALQDISVACCGEFKGLTEAIKAVYPQTRIQ